MRRARKRKIRRPKTRLGLPDLDQSKAAVIGSLRSPESQRGYWHAIDEFIDWYSSEPRLSFNRTVVSAVVFDGVNWPISVSTHLQRREDRWVIVDLVGKGGHVRPVPVPGWVKQFLDEWFTTAEVTTGKLFRCVCRSGTVWGDGMTEKVVWHVVKMYAKKLEMPQLTPHDSSEVMRPILSRSWWRIGTDPVLVGSCVRPNNRALSRL